MRKRTSEQDSGSLTLQLRCIIFMLFTYIMKAGITRTKWYTLMLEGLILNQLWKSASQTRKRTQFCTATCWKMASGVIIIKLLPFCESQCWHFIKNIFKVCKILYKKKKPSRGGQSRSKLSRCNYRAFNILSETRAPQGDANKLLRRSDRQT